MKIVQLGFIEPALESSVCLYLQSIFIYNLYGLLQDLNGNSIYMNIIKSSVVYYPFDKLQEPFDESFLIYSNQLLDSFEEAFVSDDEIKNYLIKNKMLKALPFEIVDKTNFDLLYEKEEKILLQKLYYKILKEKDSHGKEFYLLKDNRLVWHTLFDERICFVLGEVREEDTFTLVSLLQDFLYNTCIREDYIFIKNKDIKCRFKVR